MIDLKLRHLKAGNRVTDRSGPGDHRLIAVLASRPGTFQQDLPQPGLGLDAGCPGDLPEPDGQKTADQQRANHSQGSEPVSRLTMGCRISSTTRARASRPRIRREIVPASVAGMARASMGPAFCPLSARKPGTS